jgi:hypothetical protein
VQTGHDRANRDLQRQGDFFVGHLLDVTEQDDLLVAGRYPSQRRQHCLVCDLLRYRGNEPRRFSDPLVDLLDSITPLARTTSIAPDVLENRDQPRPAVGAWREPMERPQRLDQGVLHQILGFPTIVLEPHGQPEQPFGVRHRFRLEGSPQLSGGRRRLGGHRRQRACLDDTDASVFYSGLMVGLAWE